MPELDLPELEPIVPTPPVARWFKRMWTLIRWWFIRRTL